MAEKRKAFHFDLDEEKLKSFYPSDSPNGYKNAWKKIRSFMEKNGFEHTQYSGYESVKGMSYYRAFGTVEILQDTYPWFKECAQVATITEIGRRHDILEHLNNRENDSKTPERDEPLREQFSAGETGVSRDGITRRNQAEDFEQPPKRNDGFL